MLKPISISSLQNKTIDEDDEYNSSNQDEDSSEESDGDDVDGFLESMLDEHKNEPVVEIKHVDKKPTFRNLLMKFRPSSAGRLSVAKQSISPNLISRFTRLSLSSGGKAQHSNATNNSSQEKDDGPGHLNKEERERHARIMALKKLNSMSSRKDMLRRSRLSLQSGTISVVTKDGPADYEDTEEKDVVDESIKDSSDVDPWHELR